MDQEQEDEVFVEDEVVEDDDDDEPLRKKARVAAASSSAKDDIAWSVSGISVSMFMNWLRILNEMLEYVNFTVYVTPSFNGIGADTMHTGNAYAIKSRFECENPITPSSANGSTFCVRMKTFANKMKNVKSADELTLSYNKSLEKLIVVAVGKNTRRVFQINTLDQHEEPMRMKDISPSMAVDINLKDLRDFCKSNLSEGVQLLNIQIREPLLVGGGGSSSSQEQVRHTVVRLEGESDDAKDWLEFYSGTRTEREGGKFSISAVDSPPALWSTEYEFKTLYNEKFNMKMVEQVLRYMDSDMIRLNMTPTEPLTIEYYMGGIKNSFIKMLLGALISE
jgi:hypothetical protein